jgi:two-component system, response regulator PdtaR
VTARPSPEQTDLSNSSDTTDPQLQSVLHRDLPTTQPDNVPTIQPENLPTTQAPAETKRPLRIVVAEDEAIIRLDLVEMLAEEGYEVVGEASRGNTAVELVREHRPDLAIFDIKMPEMDGLAAARIVVEEEISGVIILTAFSQRELIEQARDVGVLAYLMKPFQKAELIAAIEVAVSRHRERVALTSEVRSLEDKLETRKLLDRAKGVLVKTGMTEPEAFAHIQREAMNRRTTMRMIAESILAPCLAPETSS